MHHHPLFISNHIFIHMIAIHIDSLHFWQPPVQMAASLVDANGNTGTTTTTTTTTTTATTTTTTTNNDDNNNDDNSNDTNKHNDNNSNKLALPGHRARSRGRVGSGACLWSFLAARPTPEKALRGL